MDRTDEQKKTLEKQRQEMIEHKVEWRENRERRGGWKEEGEGGERGEDGERRGGWRKMEG